MRLTYKAIDKLLPDCIAAVREWIRKELGIELSLQSVRVFVKKLGFRYRKTKPFPENELSENWLKAQEEFKTEKLFPLLGKAASGTADVLFLDSAHFVQGKFNQYLSSQEPCYKASCHGRYRINVVGGLDVAKRQVLSLINDTYVRAGTITNYMKWLRNYHYQNLDKKLYLILDNASYQKCDWVKEDAEIWNIELVYLPTYSPNLNLIERLWKWMKRELGKSYNQDKKSFRLNIEESLRKINSDESMDKFESMFSFKFQSYEKSRILTG
ncbi:MAG: IS630 family transposase [Flammeovirgaceae bacterium]|nr:IS630 family transposase [Flammeovirgaceae bacterium]